MPEHHCAQNADHLAPNTLFSRFFAEVVCDLGATPPQTVTPLPPNGGDLRHPRLRHADFTPPERFAWRKTPNAYPIGRACEPNCSAHGRLGQAAMPAGSSSYGVGVAATPTEPASGTTRTRGSKPQPPRMVTAPTPDKFRRQFPHGTNQRTLKNRRISTIRRQNQKHAHGNCMRNCCRPRDLTQRAHRQNRKFHYTRVQCADTCLTTPPSA